MHSSLLSVIRNINEWYSEAFWGPLGIALRSARAPEALPSSLQTPMSPTLATERLRLQQVPNRPRWALMG